MPSQVHALLVDLFRAAPSLALDLLRATGADVTAARLRLLDSTLPVTSSDYHVDLVVVCDDARGNPSLVVLVEVQLDPHADKRRSWPLYQAAARFRFKCDACVLVVAIEARVAEWASKPVPLGPGGSVFRAVVLGPEDVPHHVTAATPELVLLSALAHGASEPETVRAAVASVAGLEGKRGAVYVDLLRYHLGAAFDRALEAKMTTSGNPYLSDYARKYFDDGAAKGEADRARAALLTVIKARDIPLGDAERERIEACTDVVALDAWLARAARATSAAEIFAG